jgi:MFS family permease
MLWFICFFNYADRQAIFSIFPLLEAEYGFTEEQLGRIGSAFTLVYAITAPFAGQVGDRFPRKLVILGGLYVWSIVTGFTSLCTKVWHFVLVRASEGLGETFYFPASMSLVSDYHSKRTRSRAMSIHQTSVYAGTIGGGALAGWMGQTYGWWSSFVVLAVAGVVLGLVLTVFIREPQRNEAERAESGGADALHPPATMPWSTFLAGLLRNPTAIMLMVAFFGANFVGLVFLTWMPTFLAKDFKQSLAAAGVGATVFIQVGSMLGSIVGGTLADRWSHGRPGARIGVQSLGLLLGTPFIYLCGSTSELSILMVGMSFFGFFKGLYDANIWASLYDVIPPARRGSAVGVMNMVGWFGGGLGSYSLGWAVTERGMTMGAVIASTALIYLIVGCVLVLVALLLAPRDIRKAAIEQ